LLLFTFVLDVTVVVVVAAGSAAAAAAEAKDLADGVVDVVVDLLKKTELDEQLVDAGGATRLVLTAESVYEYVVA